MIDQTPRRCEGCDRETTRYRCSPTPDGAGGQITLCYCEDCLAAAEEEAVARARAEGWGPTPIQPTPCAICGGTVDTTDGGRLVGGRALCGACVARSWEEAARMNQQVSHRRCPCCAGGKVEAYGLAGHVIGSQPCDACHGTGRVFV